MDLATPPDWEFEGSLSEQSIFVAPEELKDRMKFLRTEGGSDVWLDTSAGREVFITPGSAAAPTGPRIEQTLGETNAAAHFVLFLMLLLIAVIVAWNLPISW
jgi:hypothetical protein